MNAPLLTSGIDNQRSRRHRAAKKATWKAKLLLVVGSLLFCCTLFGLAEAFCRLFLDITIQGNSRELFAANVFGDSMGLARSSHGISFGANVWTDNNCFRIPRGFVN